MLLVSMYAHRLERCDTAVRMLGSMSDRPRSPGRVIGKPHDWTRWLWGALLVVMLCGVAVRLGALHWYTNYPLVEPDGSIVRLPDTFASIDHPFHIAKERATIEALQRGWLPRWFASPQGGFPAEFYPTGADLVVAVVYFLGLGFVPVAIAHKLVIIGVFLLVPVGYWALGNRDRLPGAVVLIAAMLHLFLRGGWPVGGSRGLIDVGLWPDVFASYLPLFLLLWGADWIRFGRRRGLVLAAGVAALALYSNPRSSIGISLALLALFLIAGWEARRRPVPNTGAASTARRSWREHISRGLRVDRGYASRLGLLGARVALLGLLIGLLAAGILVPLRAHQPLYHFTHYVAFSSAGDVWREYRDDMQVWVVALAGVGFLFAWRRGFYTRTVAILLPLSYLLMLLVGWRFQTFPLFAQLEGPRLLTLLRPATLFLAALGIYQLCLIPTVLVRHRLAAPAGSAAAVAISAWLVLSPFSPVLARERGLPPLVPVSSPAFTVDPRMPATFRSETTNQPTFTAIARSAELLRQVAKPNDKPLIVGNPLSWHASFWFPALTGIEAYHSDWLWFWRTVSYGDEELLRSEPAALDLSFLRQHGLTLVLIDAARGDLLALAASRPYLRQLDAGTPGGYALYRVEPTAVGEAPYNGWAVVEGGHLVDLQRQPEQLQVQAVMPSPGEARFFVNAFPNWRATVNGKSVAPRTTKEGYIAVPLPAGAATVTLTYGVDAAGWLARGLVAAGLVLSGWLVVAGTRPWRQRPRVEELGSLRRADRIAP